MAKQVIPVKNTKLGTNSKTLSGSSYLTASRTGSGKSFDPYVDTVDLAASTKTTLTTNTSDIATLKTDVSNLKQSTGSTNKDGKAESMTFTLDLVIDSVGVQTLTITAIDTVNLANGTGYTTPTIASSDTTLGKNNRFKVSAFMDTNHSDYIVQSTYEDSTGFDYTKLQEKVSVEISNIAADEFYFRIVDTKRIPLTNLQIAKMGTLRIKFEINGTKR